MLFNSYEFIFLYLPVVFCSFFLIAKFDNKLAALWLALASLFFYGWWDYRFVALLLFSIFFNYYSGILISHTAANKKISKIYLVIAITINILILGLFKYANFFVETANIVGAEWSSLYIVLPLGVSFFTFTQIAFLVDAYKGISKEFNLIHYILFVTWFPHLIAGPVLHHKQMMPQFSTESTYRLNLESINVGLTLFAIGLFKKVMLADEFALIANPIFDQAAEGGSPALIAAWIGVLAYTLQLYFDFSGYSDMAIGLSRMFNVRLPLNFDSPYKASNIIDFWRRWHMTLSKFLFDYLYLPLGGNRKGSGRRYVNLMIVMLLGGLWHGAGWNFVLWGGLHGIYLVLNHAWRKLSGSDGQNSSFFVHGLCVFTTFIAVAIAWVPFRASNVHATLDIWRGTMGMNGISLPPSLEQKIGQYFGGFVEFGGINPTGTMAFINICIWIAIGFFIIWTMPNTQQWLWKYRPALDGRNAPSYLTWRPIKSYGLLTGFLLGTSILSLNRVSTFLYFQF